MRLRKEKKEKSKIVNFESAASMKTRHLIAIVSCIGLAFLIRLNSDSNMSIYRNLVWFSKGQYMRIAQSIRVVLAVLLSGHLLTFQV